MKAILFTLLALVIFLSSSVMIVQAQSESSIWRDDMNYQSLNQLQTAGWTITHQVGINFTGSTIVLDGTQEDTAIHYSQHFPSGISNWKVEDKSRWILGSHCGNSVTAVTDKHSYTFMADGWYGDFVFYRDGQETTFGSYQETKNEWLTLSIEKQGNQINMYYKGELKSSYTETDTSSSNLVGVDAVSPWRGGSEYDYFEVWSMGTGATEPQTSLLSNPIVLGGIIGAVGIGVAGVLYFFVLGGSGASGGASGGGSAIQNHPTSPPNGGTSSTTSSGVSSGIYHQQTSNISELNDAMQYFGETANEAWSTLPSEVQSMTPQTNRPPTPLTSILDQLVNHGQLLYNESTTQGSVNQDSYQHYLEQYTNFMDSFSHMINAQQTATSSAAHIQHQ